jgi:MtN3 and saliva related transmembrane protein
VIDAIGYAAGILAMITFLPQIFKTMRTRRSADISMTMLLLTLATNLLYVAYGAMLRLYPIVIMVGIMSCTVVLQIMLTIKYRSETPLANKSEAGDTTTQQAHAADIGSE